MSDTDTLMAHIREALALPDETPAPAAPAMQIPDDALARQALKIRAKMDAIKERHKQELEPYQNAYLALQGEALGRLNARGSSSVKTDEGTFFKKTEIKASVKDRQAYLDYVLETGDVSMVTAHLSKDAVQDYVDRYKEPPPGVEIGGVITISFRKPS